jgi:muramoyltetrapeptide carboxypeptidase
MISASSFTMPPPLRHGDRIAVVAPASPFPDQAFFTGLAWLRQMYRISVRAAVRTRTGYLAGDDERRTRELADAMLDPDVRAIFCARGGYGAMRISSALPWDGFARAPKWIVGFSDITTLHLEAAARGVATLHAPNVTGLGLGTPPQVRYDVVSRLEAPAQAHALTATTVMHAGARVSGVAFGGNLALVHAMAAAGRLVAPDGAIVFLEDVTERPYRVDRMLTSLLASGCLSRARAIVFGDFVQCDPGPDGVTIDEVLAERTRALGVPVLAGAPFGHGDVNRPIVLGAPVTVDGTSLRFFS